MTSCIFVSDLHGKVDRYEKLFRIVDSERPAGLFLGGDLLPSHHSGMTEEFLGSTLIGGFSKLKRSLGSSYPAVFLILGNDDARIREEEIIGEGSSGLWHYAHGSKKNLHHFPVFGYSYVPPTPFRLKDWERYDVSRFTDPGCISPEEGWHSVPVSERDLRHRTIEMDLNDLTGKDDLSGSILLLHSPPHNTKLDLAALAGRTVDNAPLDPHVGSIAVRRLIESRQPLVTLHGHVHESTRLSGTWKDRIGRSHMFSAAHDGPELAVVRFSPEALEDAGRTLV